MDANLHSTYQQVMDARQPEDLFGSEDIVLPEQTLLDHLADVYGRLKEVTKPSVYSDLADVEAATEADDKLESLYNCAQTSIRRQTYGIDGRGKLRPAYATKSFAVGPNRYYLGRQFYCGDHAVLYEAFLERDGVNVGEVTVKIAKDTSCNAFLQTEVRNLEILHARSVPQWKHLPLIMDRFQSAGRVGLVFRKISGFSLTTVRQHRAHCKGVDRKHIAWMLDRTLSVLGYVHRQGVVHGDLKPEHFIVQPVTHNALICGWGAAVDRPAITGEKIIVAASDFTAPEVRDRGKIGPWSDIYSLGKVFIWLMGGDHKQNEIPSSVEKPFSQLIQSMVDEDPLVRPGDAWALYEEQCRIKHNLWPKQFIHFDMA